MLETGNSTVTPVVSNLRSEPHRAGATGFRVSLVYSLLAAVVTLNGGITGIFSFPEMIHQRPLDFSALVISILHDSKFSFPFSLEVL